MIPYFCFTNLNHRFNAITCKTPCDNCKCDKPCDTLPVDADITIEVDDSTFLPCHRDTKETN